MKTKTKTLLKFNKFVISKLNTFSVVAGNDNPSILGGDDKKKSGNLFCLTRIGAACKLEETKENC